MAINPIDRREFVGDLARAGLAFTIVPRHVLGHGFQAPSDTLNVACVGVGGMGRNDVNGMGRTENIVALCDVDERSAADSFRNFPKATRYKDFRELLDKERDIDAITVSTPDHVHASVVMAALSLGKHVYCQKPLARTIGEVRQVMAKAKTTKVATQMGNQGHAAEGTRQIREWVEAGLIGPVREVHYWTDRPIWPQAIERPTEMHTPPATLDWNLWLGPAPERPYHPAYAPFRWRGWWDFGTGALGDIACHAMDAAFWTLDLGFPTSIVPESTKLYTETAPASSRITYEFPERNGRPAVTVVWRDGSMFPQRPPEVPQTAVWPAFADGGQLWVGDKGKLIAGMYGQNPRLLDPEQDAAVKANPPAEKYPRVESVYAEWIAACKNGTTGGSSFDGHAGPLTQMVLLGNLAVRTGRAVMVNPATGEISGADVPSEFLMPEYRNY
ncbi:MAG TPA: Gfo/Idh/MocA family oxidoreductase [Gemmatimonadaceae bacterium]|nr:Gfo/Idh/MocA family oxidoreductase [Gemmatimonadaceae bacterium]